MTKALLGDVLMSMILKGRVTMLDLFQYDFMQRALLAMVAMSLFFSCIRDFLNFKTAESDE